MEVLPQAAAARLAAGVEHLMAPHHLVLGREQGQVILELAAKVK